MTASPCAGYSSARAQTDTHRAESRCRDVFSNPQLTSHSTPNFRAPSRRLDSPGTRELLGTRCSARRGPAGRAARSLPPSRRRRPPAGTDGGPGGRSVGRAPDTHALLRGLSQTLSSSFEPRSHGSRSPPPPAAGLHAASRAARSVPPSRGHAPGAGSARLPPPSGRAARVVRAGGSRSSRFSANRGSATRAASELGRAERGRVRTRGSRPRSRRAPNLRLRAPRPVPPTPPPGGSTFTSRETRPSAAGFPLGSRGQGPSGKSSSCAAPRKRKCGARAVRVAVAPCGPEV